MRQNPILLAIEANLIARNHRQLNPTEFRHLTYVLQTLFGGTRETVLFYDLRSFDDMKGQFQSKDFASISLNKADEEKFSHWCAESDLSAVQIAEDFLSRGYKLSVSWVTNNNAFCLSVIGTEDCRDNKSAIMTSWSDQLEECFYIAAYKHVVLCGEGTWPIAGTDNRWG